MLPWAVAKVRESNRRANAKIAAESDITLEDAQSRLFTLKMKDRWSDSDFTLADRLESLIAAMAA